ncbi:hypothetical protein PO909_032355 [Leuciscus waleckii]
MEETIPSHSQFQRSHSDDGSGLQDVPSSVVFSLQDTLKMALTKRNLDPPPPLPGQSNLLRHSVSQQEDFLMPSCPDFTDVVSSAFRSAPLSRPDRVAHTLAAMAEADEKGLGNMPPVEPCVSSLMVSPEEALRHNLRCPNPECRRTDDLLVKIYNTVSGLSRVGNSMAHLLLALHSALSTNPPDNTASELLEAFLQALGSIAFSNGKALGLTTQAWRQVWLAQSKLPEACRSNLRQLPLVPGQICGPAAQEALERRVRAVESRYQHFECSVNYGPSSH